MKKLVITVIIVSMLLCVPVFAENASFKFRGTEFGSPMSEVITSAIDYELNKDDDFGTDDYKVDTDRFIIYDRTVGGHQCDVNYFLVDKQFADGAYIFREDHTNYELYYSDYTDLLSKYIKKYGDPDEDQKKWIGDSIYKDKPDKYGMAVAVGDLQLYTKWEAEDGSIIQFRMAGDNFDVVIRIDYLCPGYDELKEQANDDSDDGI